MKKLILPLVVLAVSIMSGCTYVVDSEPKYCTKGQATLTDCTVKKGCIVTLVKCSNNTY